MVASCFLGVDGGGTKTRFVLIDDAGQVLAEAQMGTTYHPEVGLGGVRDVLRQGIAQVLDRAGLGMEAIAHAFFGLPAYGEDSSITPQLDALPRQLLGHDRYQCNNDMICGWAGSLACDDGINIIAGTGSMGYGQCQGREGRAGGWGEAFSDEGSAHWIAIRGLNAFSRMSDGRLPRGPLYEVFRQALGLELDLDLCALIYGDNAYTRGQIAQLSQRVSEAAELGDTVANAIFADAGRELAGIADALRRSLQFPVGQPVPLSWSGGAFSAGEVLLQPFHQALVQACTDFIPTPPRHAPHYGAALYAALLHGRRIPTR